MKVIIMAGLLFVRPARAGDVVPPPAVEPDRSRPVEAGPMRAVEFPVLRRLTANHGIVVTADELKALPIVALSIVIPASAEARATLLFPEAAGLASLTASLLNENTKKRGGNAFSRAMESLGASYSISQGEDALFVGLFAKKGRIRAAAELVAEAVLRPAFRRADLERAKAETHASLEASAASPDATARRRMIVRIFGKHPYGAHMTPETLAHIKDTTLLVKYHASAYRPEGVSIHAAGDMSVEEVKALAEKSFSQWPSVKVRMDALKAIPKVPTPDMEAAAIHPGVIELIDQPGAPQSIIRIGQTALPYNHPDYHALSVLVSILGGSHGRLFEILREQKKWAYGASASLGANRDGGSLLVHAPIQTDKTGEALIVILSEIKRLREEDVTSAELEKIKVHAELGAISQLETVQSIAGARAGAELYGLGDDVFRTSRDAILAVTVQDVRRVAKLYLRPESAAIVIAGDASKIKAELEKIAPVRVIDAEGRPAVETASAAWPFDLSPQFTGRLLSATVDLK